jgi:glycosyltransferase involved in cell wall biosynthesis
MGHETVAILLSTYNGSAHLDYQLLSIMKQTWPCWTIVARDDGSTDDTPTLLKNWSERIPLEICGGPHIGVTSSFFHLLYNCPEYDFVAFADQDDVWQPDKLSRSLSVLKTFSPRQPAMYCSRAEVTNGDLLSLGFTQKWPQAPCFANALVQNIAIGCTTVINRAALKLLTTVAPPKYALMHDHWCYVVISALGRVVFDKTATILYRQHSHNSVGFEVSSLKRLKAKILRFMYLNSLPMLFDQAADFHTRYEQRLSSECRNKLEEFLSFRNSIWHCGALTSTAFRRQHRIDDLLLRARIAFPFMRQVL